VIALLFLIGLAFAVIIVLVVSSLNSNVKQLQREVRMLGGKVAQFEQALSPAGGIEGKVERPAATVPPPATTVQHASMPTPPVLVTSPQPTPVPQTPQPSPPTRSRAEWEALIGGKFLNRIGAVALFIGMAFFFKYAFDRNWISEWSRVGIGLATGIALLAGGARFRRKGLAIFAHGLVGAGVSILYLSVYAAFNFYHLVSQPVAFGLMALVTAVTFAQAFVYDALAVSLLGWIGGFLTPFLLSTGEAQPVGLFSYIAMLDLGLIAILIHRGKWSILAPLSLVATYFIYYLWYASSAGIEDNVAAVVFLGLFWILFHLWDLAGTVRKHETTAVLRDVTAIAHTILIYPGLYTIVDRYFPSWLVPATLLLAALYGVSALVAKRSTGTLSFVTARHAIAGIVLLVIGTEIQLGDFVVIVAFAVEAIAVFWLGRKLALKPLSIAGLGILIWACLMAVSTEHSFVSGDPGSFVLIWNIRSLAYISVACGAMVMLLLMKHDSEDSTAGVRNLLHLVWILFILLLVALETADYHRHLAFNASGPAKAYLSFQNILLIGVFWMAFGTLLLTSGQKTRPVTVTTIAGFCLTVLGTIIVALRGIAFDPVSMFTPVLNIRALVLLIAAGLLGWSLVRVQAENASDGWQSAVDWGVRPVMWVRIMIVVVSLVLISGEIRDYYERAIAMQGGEDYTVTNDLENLKQMFLSAGWLVYSVALMVLGLVRRLRSIRIVAIILFGVAIVKIFFYDLSFLETLYRIFSFIGLGIILLTVSFLYTRYRGVIIEETPQS
jgi:uncharacterized membrane protein